MKEKSKPKFPPREGDLTREELVKRANKAIADHNCHVDVLFKFTCPECGERCTLQEPNVLYENGECCSCGAVSPIQYGGFTLHMILNKPPHEK